MLPAVSGKLFVLNSGNIAVLTLLDLSAVSDGVNYDMLLQQLQISYGLGGSVLVWFKSYLNNQTQYMCLSATKSTESAVLYGVPQGLLFGPILFLIYISDLLRLVKHHQFHPHAYADDMRFTDPVIHLALQQHLSVHVYNVSQWMMSNWLQLNHTKTESFGVHLLDASSRFQVAQSKLETHQ